MGFSRNTEAEKSQSVLIPKDTELLVGIESVEGHVNTMSRGDHKGRKYDKYKMGIRILEPGDYYGKLIKMSVSCLIERAQGDGDIVAYGNSKKYCNLLKAIDPSISDDEIPAPRNDAALDKFGSDHFVGNLFMCTFGIYTFTNDEGQKVQINTIKDSGEINEELMEACKSNIEKWKAEMAVKQPGGAADDFDPDDF